MTAAKERNQLEQADELLTNEEFAEIHFDEVAELVEGTIQLMGNNNPNHSEALGNMTVSLKLFIRKKKLGKVYAGDVSVITKRDPDTTRGIDLAYVSFERLADQPEGASALQVAPELAIEIMSPSNPWDNVLTKAEEYFGIGALEVWVVSLPVRTVTVLHSLTEMKGYSLEQDAVLKCPSILPGFELPLEEIFEGD